MSDLCQLLETLTYMPFSPRDLFKLQETTKAVQRRYPSWQLSTDGTAPVCGLVLENEPWTGYAKKVSGITCDIDNRVTKSMRGLLRDDDVTEDDIETYLGLLNDPRPGTEITGIIRKQNLTQTLNARDRDKTTLIPIRDEQGWAFVVADGNCIHWYDSKPNSAIPDFASDGWRGPQSPRVNDSGVLMLLGIRCISSGLPHVDDENAEGPVKQFRIRLLLELACKHLDPHEDEVPALNEIEDNKVSSFFDDAFLDVRDKESRSSSLGRSADDEASRSSSVDRPMHDEASRSSSVDRPMHDEESQPSSLAQPAHGQESRSSSLEQTALSQESPLSSDAMIPPDFSIQSQTAPAPARRIHCSPIRKLAPLLPNIYTQLLDILSDAVAVNRSVHASNTTEFEVLWSLVKRENPTSEFHRRHCMVLLHDQLQNRPNHRNTDMTMLQEDAEFPAIMAQCRLWNNLCAWGQSRGLHRFVMLCAIPKYHRFCEASLQTFIDSFPPLPARKPLENDLWYAQGLCDAIVAYTLPNYLLAIEVYPGRRHDYYDSSLFAEFVHMREYRGIPIPRQSRLWRSGLTYGV
ncbi:hypothetical protein EDB80DRAFT_596077 [Ilyonectria destructans]|nr:hypothetical protein EDB80DRAFT_596077 [Ilyonectria destructans]